MQRKDAHLMTEENFHIQPMFLKEDQERTEDKPTQINVRYRWHKD